MDSDERFKHLAKDPRFKKLRKPKAIGEKDDDRFKARFTDKRFVHEEKNKRGWYTSDESTSSDESDSEPEEEIEVNRINYDWQPLDHDAEKTEEISRRLAIQNLDWDHLDAKDIYALVNSVRPPLSIRIYISEFGKERLAREEREGPEELADLAKVDDEEEEYKDLEAKMKLLENQDKISGNKFKINEYEDADEAVDSKNEDIRERIRRYQLSKMKYYYAIAEFDSAESAEAVYKELDGMDYEGSSLELDLRFVPDEMEFNADDLKSECDKSPDLSTYKAPQFINSALQQTTVKFTWDETDIKRQEKLRRAYTKQELEKDDLEAYLGSGTDSDGNESELDEENNDKISVITGNSEARANKYKLLLKNLEEEEAKKKKVDVDVVWGDYDQDEMNVAKNGGQEEVDEYDSDDGDDSDKEVDDDDDISDDVDDEEDESGMQDDEDAFDDADGESEEEQKEQEVVAPKRGNKKNKNEKKVKRKVGADNGTSDKKTDEDLDLLMLDIDARPTGEFEFDPDDDRFKAIYESGLYNIDPSHPGFKRSKAFEQIAEKKRSKRQKR